MSSISCAESTLVKQHNVKTLLDASNATFFCQILAMAPFPILRGAMSLLRSRSECSVGRGNQCQDDLMIGALDGPTGSLRTRVAEVGHLQLTAAGHKLSCVEF